MTQPGNYYNPRLRSQLDDLERAARKGFRSAEEQHTLEAKVVATVVMAAERPNLDFIKALLTIVECQTCAEYRAGYGAGRTVCDEHLDLRLSWLSRWPDDSIRVTG